MLGACLRKIYDLNKKEGRYMIDGLMVDGEDEDEDESYFIFIGFRTVHG